MTHLVFDIETIPDYTLWTPPAEPALAAADPAAPLPGQLALVQGGAAPPPVGDIIIPPTGTKTRKPRARKTAPNGEVKDPFAPHYAHRVVAIGFTWLDLDASADEFIRGVGCVGTSAFGDNEAGLLTAWDDFVKRESPTVVTFAGRTFDVPVLSLRALRHGIAQAWADNGYRHRYGDQHADLFDLLTEHGAVQRAGFSLEAFCAVIGLPAKGEDRGSNVRAMWEKGEVAKIEGLCCSDSVRTAFLLLRYKLMRGQLTTERYRELARHLLSTAGAMGLGSITFGVDTKRLLLEG
ncbi:MAG: hypothetical protein A2Y38_19880 [Spirochaetes bacterium GWB1_59_5]|nr:MAG: hypothetical protein A2Y38_19880 [Spirochaetes bacterium GWB1_59_5]